MFSSYLHGALHDRDSHDSIFYGDCFSVHEPGMGCKVKIKTVPWEWCCLAGFNNSYTFKCICIFALTKTMIIIKFKKYTLLIDRNYYGYPILLIHQQNAEIYVVIFVPTPPKTILHNNSWLYLAQLYGKEKDTFKKTVTSQLQFARRHLGDSEVSWKKLLFSGESKTELFGHLTKCQQCTPS